MKRTTFTYSDGSTVPGTVQSCGCIRPDDAGDLLGWHLTKNHSRAVVDDLADMAYRIAQEVEYLDEDDRARLKPLVDRLARLVSAEQRASAEVVPLRAV